jgi:hypothetical protein
MGPQYLTAGIRQNRLFQSFTAEAWLRLLSAEAVVRQGQCERRVCPIAGRSVYATSGLRNVRFQDRRSERSTARIRRQPTVRFQVADDRFCAKYAPPIPLAAARRINADCTSPAGRKRLISLKNNNEKQTVNAANTSMRLAGPRSSRFVNRFTMIINAATETMQMTRAFWLRPNEL